MRTIKIDLGLHDDKAIALELEHIAQLINNQGFTEGVGWSIVGDEEEEKTIEKACQFCGLVGDEVITRLVGDEVVYLCEECQDQTL